MPSLLIDIGANIARLQQDVAKANRTIDGFAKTAKAAFVGLGAGISVAGIASFIKGTLDSADALDKLSKKVGISVEDLSEYKYIAEMSGASMEQFAKGMQILSRNMVDAAQGTGEAKEAFKALGVNITDAEGRLRSNKDVMLDVAERFSKMDDGATKTAAAMKIFGKSGAELIPVLNEGREGIQKLGAEVDALGIRMTEELAAAADEVNDNLDRMRKSAEGAGIQLMHALMPALQEIAKWGVEAAEGLAMLISQTEKGEINRRILEINDEIRALQGELAEIGPDQAASPGLFSRIWDSFFGDGTPGKEKAQARIKELEGELQQLGIKLHEVSQPKPPTVIGSKLGPTDEEIKKAQRDYEAFLKDVDKLHREAVKSLGPIDLGDVNQAQRLDDELAKVKKAEEEAAKERMEMYRKIGEEEEEAWNAKPVKVKEIADKMSLIWEHTAELMQDNFSSLFLDVMQGKLEGFAEFAKRIFQSIQKAAADYLGQAAMELIFGEQKKGENGGLLSGLFKSFSLFNTGGTAAGASAFTAAEMNSMMWLHHGGEVGPGAPRRMMPSYLMAGAPKLHGGLASDEYPAILQKGERVVSRSEASKGDKIPSFNVVINAVDSASFTELAARNPQAIVGPFLTALQQGGQVRNAIRSVM